MPTQTARSMSRSRDDLFLFSESELELIQALLQDDLRSSAGNDLCASARHLPVFGPTYPVSFFFLIFYVYSIFNWKRKSASRLPLAKHVTSVINRYASDYIIQAHEISPQCL